MRIRRVHLVSMLGRLFLCACVPFLFPARAGAQASTTLRFSVLEDTLSGMRTPLDALIQTALKDNLPLQVSRARARASQAQVDVAGGAFQPALNGSGTFSRQNLSNDLQTGGTLQDYETRAVGVGISRAFGVGAQFGLNLETTRRAATLAGLGHQSDYLTDLSVSLQQPLLEGFGTADAPLRAARHGARAARDRAHRAVEEMVAQVETSYWTLAEAEATERVRRKSLAVADTLRFRNTQLYKRGLASELDMLTAESGVAIRKANWIEARRLRLDAADALVFAVYGPHASDYLRKHMQPIKTVPEPIAPPPILPLAQAEAQALSTRPDVAAAREDLRQAGTLLHEAKNALLPSLNFQSSLGTEGNASGPGGAFKRLDRNLTWSAGLVFSNFLGNRSDHGRYEAAHWQYEQQRLALQELENGVRQEVRAAVRAMQAVQQELAQADRAVGFASRQLAAERKRLDLGLGDSFRVLQTEETVAQAELTAVHARFGLARAGMNYRLALGLLAQPYEK